MACVAAGTLRAGSAPFARRGAGGRPQPVKRAHVACRFRRDAGESEPSFGPDDADRTDAAPPPATTSPPPAAAAGGAPSTAARSAQAVEAVAAKLGSSLDPLRGDMRDVRAALEALAREQAAAAAAAAQQHRGRRGALLQGAGLLAAAAAGGALGVRLGTSAAAGPASQLPQLRQDLRGGSSGGAAGDGGAAGVQPGGEGAAAEGAAAGEEAAPPVRRAKAVKIVTPQAAQTADELELLRQCERAAPDGRVVQELLQRGTELNVTGGADRTTPLHRCVLWDNEELVRLLLRSGATVHCCTLDGTTPLHLSKSREVTRLLLRAGAQVDARDERSEAPLHYKAQYGFAGAASALIEGGADVDAREQSGRTPLHVAAARDRWEVVRALLRARCEVDPADQDGRTPLMLAVSNGAVSCTRLLLVAGADLRVRDRYGRSADDLAAGHTLRRLLAASS